VNWGHVDSSKVGGLQMSLQDLMEEASCPTCDVSPSESQQKPPSPRPHLVYFPPSNRRDGTVDC
jgi:hypothetical protein